MSEEKEMRGAENIKEIMADNQKENNIKGISKFLLNKDNGLGSHFKDMHQLIEQSTIPINCSQ